LVPCVFFAPKVNIFFSDPSRILSVDLTCSFYKKNLPVSRSILAGDLAENSVLAESSDFIYILLFLYFIGGFSTARLQSLFDESRHFLCLFV